MIVIGIPDFIALCIILPRFIALCRHTLVSWYECAAERLRVSFACPLLPLHSITTTLPPYNQEVNVSQEDMCQWGKSKIMFIFKISLSQIKIFYFTNLLLERREGIEKKRKRKINVEEIWLHYPSWGPGLQPRHVP